MIFSHLYMACGTRSGFAGDSGCMLAELAREWLD
jgi:hypothetical protein